MICPAKSEVDVTGISPCRCWNEDLLIRVKPSQEFSANPQSPGPRNRLRDCYPPILDSGRLGSVCKPDRAFVKCRNPCDWSVFFVEPFFDKSLFRFANTRQHKGLSKNFAPGHRRGCPFPESSR